MAKARGLRLIINLLLVVLLLGLLWIGLGQPLPTKLNYWRMERAMLLEPMKILTCSEEHGVVISADNNNMAIYCDDWSGGNLLPQQLELVPVKDGVGLVAQHDFFYGLMLWAYETSGCAVRADLKLTLLHEEVGAEVICKEAERQDDLFHFEVDSAYLWSDDWRIYVLRDIALWEMGKDSESFSGYEMVITFYDEAGNVTAVRESGYEP